MKAKILTRFVDNVKPQVKKFDVFDTDLRGFCLTVRPNGSKSYSVWYRNTDGRKTRYTIGDALEWTAAAARDKAKETLARVHLDEDPQAEKREKRAPSKTLRDFLDGDYGRWCESNRKAGKHTVSQLKGAFGDLLDMDLKDLSGFHVERWRAAKVKAAQAKATDTDKPTAGKLAVGNRDIARLKAALGKAVAWGLIPANPLTSVKLNKSDRRKEIRALTPEEETALFDALDTREEALRAARDSHNTWLAERNQPLLPDLRDLAFVDYARPLITVLLHTGIRRGEAFALRWADIDFPRAFLTVRGERAKSSQSRRIPLNAVAFDALRRWRAQNPEGDIVFPNPDTGAELTDIKKLWASLTKKAGISGLRLHDLRHSFATRALAKGADIRTVQALLGHADIATTSVYLHTDDIRLRAAVEALA